MSTASLPATSDPASGPTHVAIIMDGNGRWAKARALPRVAGHRRGADAVRRVVRGAGELGIPILTLFAFSTENWTRPTAEVTQLMEILGETVDRELPDLAAQGVRTRFFGRRDRVPASVRVKMTVTTPGCPMHDSLRWGVQNALLNLDGVTAAEVELVFDPPWHPSMMTDAGRAITGANNF